MAFSLHNPQTNGFYSRMDMQNNTTLLRYFDDYESYYHTIVFSVSIWLMILYTIFTLVGIVGNILVITVIFIDANLHEAPFGVYAGALAMADLMVGLSGIPLYVLSTATIAGHPGKPFTTDNTVMCRLVTGYNIMFYFSIVGVFTLLAICFQLLFSVCNTSSVMAVRTTSRARKIVITIWFFVFVLNVNTMIDEEYSTSTDPYIGKYCKFSVPHRSGLVAKIFYGIIFTVQFVIPLSLIVFSLLKVRTKLKAMNVRANGQVSYGENEELRVGEREDLRGGEREHLLLGERENFRSGESEDIEVIDQLNRSLKTLSTAAIIRFILWTPNRVLYFCFNIGWIKMTLYGTNADIVQSSVLFYFVTCTINPLVYAIWNRSFRRGYASVLKCNRRRREYAHIPGGEDESVV